MLVMGIEQSSPASITEDGSLVRRVHDVSEEGSGEDALNLYGRALTRDKLGDHRQRLGVRGRRRTEIGVLKFDKRCPLDVVRQVLAQLNRHNQIATAVQDESRGLDEGKCLTHIEGSQDVVELSCGATGGGRRPCDPCRPLSEWVIN